MPLQPRIDYSMYDKLKGLSKDEIFETLNRILIEGENGYVMSPLDAIATIEDTRIRRYCCPTAYIC